MNKPKKGECPLRCLVLPLLTYLVAAGTDYIHSVLLNKPLNCCNFQRVTSAGLGHLWDRMRLFKTSLEMKNEHL